MQFTANGTKVLTELHQTTTDGLGVFSINIGSGQRIGGTLSGLDKVDWANGPYYLGLKIAIKPFSPVSNWDYTKELIDLGASSFGTVPYAYYAGSTANVKDVIKATDTASMLLPYAKASALQQINTNLSLKVNVADSTTIYVTPTQLKAVKFDTSLIYNLLSEKEILTNKSVNVNADSTSNTKYPSVRAVKSYVDLQFSNFVLADGSVSTAKLANGAVTNEKIISVAGSKITGDIAGNAATATKLAAPKNINGLPFDGSADITIAADAATLSGTVVVAKGGTGATTAADARTNLGLVIGTNVLAQRSFGTAANSAATDFVAATEKGANNGVATLGVNGKIPSVQIPAISFQSVSVVNSDATMTAISGAQVGSIAIRSDLNINYVLSALPATTLSNWIQLAASTDVSTINGIVGPSVNLTTNEIPEGNTNKYYTDARVRGAVSAVAPLNFNASSGVLSMTTASTTSAGFLTASDFNTFNNKQATLTAGVDYATPSGNITGNAANVTGIVSIANGGTGTSTATGALVALGAEPSDNKSDNILVDGASTTKFPTFRAIKSYVDQQSQNAGVADNSITSAKINGTLAVLKGGTGASNPADARTNLGLVIGTDVMAANATTTLTGDVTGAGNGSFATTLANSGVTSGTYGSSTAIPTLTVDSKGRITSAGTVGIIAGVNSLNYTSSTSYAAGGTISGTSLTLAAADGTNPGLVSTGAQTIAGAKTFSNTTTFNNDISVNGYRIGKGAANVGSNVALGFLAMNNASSSGINNVSIGSNTLSSLSSGNNNIAIGANALTNVTTGGNNIAIGKDALTNLPTSGTSNTAIGTLALTAATSSNNTAIGNGAGTRVTSGESNVIVGSTTGIYLTTGSNNLMLGNLAGSGTGTGGVNNVTGTNSVFIGRSAQPQNDGQANQVVIAGYDGTNANTGLGSNTTLIGNTATTQTQIMGALNLPNTTSSTSTTTGGLVVAGGVGIAGAANIGGDVTAPNFLGNVTGTVTGNLSGTANTATNLAGGVSGSIPYQTAAGTTAMIPVGAANQFLTSVAGGTYTWTSTSAVTGNFVPYTGASGAVDLGAYDIKAKNAKFTGDIYTTPPSPPSASYAYDNTNYENNNGLVVHTYNQSGFPSLVSFVATGKKSGNFSSSINFLTRPSGTTAEPLERLRITRDGYVGIGTSTPTTTLDVVGGGKLSGDLAIGGTITSGTWSGTTIGSNYGGAGSINGLLKANGTGVVSAAISGTDFQAPLTAGSGISIASGTISATGLTNANLSSTAGITNAQLANSSTILGATTMTLGGTVTSVTGLTSLEATTLTGNLSGTANTATNLAGGISGSIPYQTAAGTTAMIPVGSANQFLTSVAGGTYTWTSTSAVTGNFVPYSGASGGVNLGAYDLTVNGLTIGKGRGALTDNTAVGTGTLSSTTSGEANTAIGAGALGKATSTTSNTAVGANALRDLTSGRDNTAIGSYASTRITTGQRNIAVGYSALDYITTSSDNTAVGTKSLQYNSGLNNTALGAFSLQGSNGSGGDNTAIGKDALKGVFGAAKNTALGSGSLVNLTTGDENIALGYNAGALLGSGAGTPLTNLRQGIIIGNGARPKFNNSLNEVVIGFGVVGNGSNTVTIGTLSNTATYFTGDINLTGNVNGGTWSGTTIGLTKGGTGATTAADARTNLGLTIGTDVMAANFTTTLTGDVTGAGNGSFATTLANSGVTSGTYGSSTAIPVLTVDTKGRVVSANTVGIVAGVNSLNYTSTTSYAAGGTISGTSLTLTAADGTNPGLISTSAQTIAGAKTFNSDLVVNGMTVGKGGGNVSNNTALGFNALTANVASGTPGINNTAVGYNSLSANTTGGNNVAIGNSAGSVNVGGSNNVFIGNNANAAAGLVNNANAIAIGSNAIVDAPNKIQLGDQNITAVNTSGTITAAGFTGPLSGNATTATTAGNITATSNTTLTSLANLAAVGTITSGVWSATEVAVAKGGTGATNAADARTNLGLGSLATKSTIANADVASGAAIDFSKLNITKANITGLGIQDGLTAGSGITIASGTISVTGLTTANLNSSAGITNAQLANSTTTLGSTTLTLGSTVTSVAGLTSLSATNLTGTLSGTATSLATGRTISTTGDVTYTSGAFDGSANVTGVATLAASGVTSGTYGSSTAIPVLTVDTKGRVTTASTVSIIAGVNTMTAISATSNANGATISGTALTLTPADATNGGVVTTAAQTFAGAKTFSNTAIFNTDITVNGLIFGKGNGNVNTNTASGASALAGSNSGTGQNTAMGHSALNANTSGRDNTGIGFYALNTNQTGNSNTAIGSSALKVNTGSNNDAFGASALAANTTGTKNTAFGGSSLVANQDGGNNTAIGVSALQRNVSGDDNLAAGYLAGQSNTGSENVFLGSNSGRNTTSVSNNIFIGNKAGLYYGTGTDFNVNGNGNVMIGNDVRPQSNNQNNQIVISGYTSGNGTAGLGANTTLIGNSATTLTQIMGDLTLPRTTASTSTTSGALQVAGGAGIAGALNVGGTTTLTGAATISNTTASTSTTTGALVVRGGVGVAGNVTIGGTLEIDGGSPAAGKVLTSDANGVGSWTYSVGSTVVTSTSTYAITLAEAYVFYNGSANGAFTIPAAAAGNAGKTITIKNKSAFNIVITPSTTANIYIDKDNTAATTVTIGVEASNNWIKLVSDGSQWNVFRALF